MSFFVTSQTLSTLARNNKRRSQSRLFTQMKPLTNHDLSSRSTVPPANDWNGFLPRHEMLSVELRLLQEFPDLGLFKMRYGALQPAAQLPSGSCLLFWNVRRLQWFQSNLQWFLELCLLGLTLNMGSGKKTIAEIAGIPEGCRKSMNAPITIFLIRNKTYFKNILSNLADWQKR